MVHDDIEASTRTKYTHALRQWRTFTAALGLDFRPTEETLALFVAWRLREATTVHGTLSGLAYFLRPLMGKDWDDIREATLVKRAIRGGTKRRATVVRRAPPLPHALLRRSVHRHFRSGGSYDDALFFTIATVAFFACARSAEVLDSDTPRYRRDAKRLKRERTQFRAQGFRSYLPYAKNDPMYSGSYLFFVAGQAEPLFFLLLERYRCARDDTFGTTGPLFLKSDGTVPTQAWFLRRVKATFGRQYRLHSFRPGGITYLVQNGMSDADAKRQGRWRSSAWEDYVRCHPDLEMAIALRNSSKTQRHLPIAPHHLPNHSLTS